MSPAPSLASVRALDAGDELASYRSRFVIDDPNLIYLDGNSLGRLPLATAERMRTAVATEWGQRLIRGWNEGWMEAAGRIGGKLARILGARAGEVIVADSTSVNLYKLALATLQARPGRRKIVTDSLNFPSDIYILQSVAQLAGHSHRLEIVPSADDVHGPVAALAAALDEDTALLALSHTVFKSGYTYDMAAITRLAHAAGALVLWDVSHSAGVVPIHLNAAGVDLAVGCTYKYLNGGPGSPAFLYVRQDLQPGLANPIAGWMGHGRQFEFEIDYEPAAGLRRFLTGTPPVLSLLAIEPGLDLLLEAGIESVRAKSMRQTQLLVDLWREWLAPLGFRLNSPDVSGAPASARRGSHISLAHDDGNRIVRALIDQMAVLPDFRQPDLIRVGIAPLYTSYEDVYEGADRLRRLVEGRSYESPVTPSGIVT